MYGLGGHKLGINIPPQQIFANSKGGGLIIEGGIMSSEYGIQTQKGTNSFHIKSYSHNYTSNVKKQLYTI